MENNSPMHIAATKDFASEGGHFYLPDGTPYYTIIGANGKERDVTLRDAKKVGAFPSVTKIIREAAAPGLERWRLRQLGLALLTLPRLDGESEDAFLERAEKDAQEQGRKAAERGTAIHAAIEQHYRGEEIASHLLPWVCTVVPLIETNCPDYSKGGELSEWSAERSAANPLGYGCRVDLHSRQWVLDFKTKDDDRSELYDEPVMQVAANRKALEASGMMPEGGRCAIVFVNRNQPRAQFVEVSEEKLGRGWEMFRALLTYWQAKTGYRP